jgi:hypothetical protein
MNEEFVVSCSVAVVGEDAFDMTGSIANPTGLFLLFGMNKCGYKTNPFSVFKLGSDMLLLYCNNSFCGTEAASSSPSREIDEVVVAMTDESSIISSTSSLSNSTTASTISNGSL